MDASPGSSERRPPSRAEEVYRQLRRDIFEFRLLPGDRFTENEVALRLEVSRTPVREALYRLQKEGHLQVYFRSGWRVRELDFKQFDHLYDLRIVLEAAAVQRLCDLQERPGLDELKSVWLVPAEERPQDGTQVCVLDEDFHSALMDAAGNPELARCHREVTDRIRILRQLDFTKAARISATYQEHAQILRAILRRRGDQAVMLLRAHVESSKAEVRKIGLHQLYGARPR